MELIEVEEVPRMRKPVPPRGRGECAKTVIRFLESSMRAARIDFSDNKKARSAYASFGKLKAEFPIETYKRGTSVFIRRREEWS